MGRTYRIERAERVRTGKDARGTVLWEDKWAGIKSGLSLERAEELLRIAKTDTRGCLWTLRIVEETPAPQPAPTPKVRKPRRPFDAIDQERRVAAAIVQAGDYHFSPLNPGEWICDGPRGSFLVTEEGGCSCEDATYTTGPVGARCKHAVMLGHRLIEMGAAMMGEPVYPAGPADLSQPVRFAVAA